MINDKTTIQQVLGGLIKNPKFLNQSDKYQLDIYDFSSRFEKFLFTAINNLNQNGLEKIKIIDIENYFENDNLGKSVFEQNNGIQYLQDLIEFTDESNFDFYYHKLKKINLLRDYQKMGIDISDFYVEDLTKPKAFEINQKFELLTINDISSAIKKKFLALDNKYLKNDVTEVESAADGIEELISGFERHEDIGLPIQGFIINEIMGGARRGTLTIRGAASGTGKALPNSTILPTPNGKKRVNEIKVGDYLFDAFGKPTKVLGVYPQGRKEVNYVRFKDGRISLCCDEHLWSYCTLGQKESSKKERKFYTKTLKELKEEKLQNTDGSYRILIPMNYAVEYSKKEYYIPPYIFGLALGDGSFKQHNSNKSFQFSSENDELPNIIGKTMGWKVKKNSGINYTWYFSFKEKQKNSKDKINIWVEDFLKDYPNLINCSSKDKYIPEDYLYGSVEQRYDLLNGLLDSDGSVDEKGRIKYYTISPKLRDNVVELCHSLGFKTTVLVDDHKDTNIGFVVHITGRPADKVKLFKLKRKKELIEKWYNSNIRKESNEFNPIVEIGTCGYVEEMTCFYVDNKEHLFLTEDYIVTHNTRNAVADACFLAFPIRFDMNKGCWEQTGNCERVLFIATEQDFNEIRKMILAYLTDINEDRFRYGEFNDLEEKIISDAVKVLNKYKENFLIVRMPNPTIELVKHLVRENCLVHDIKYVFYDYIFIGPALLNEFRGMSLRSDELLLMFATALKDLAVELNVFIMTSTQLNANGDDNKNIRNESALAGGRSTINKADYGFIMARPTKEELEAIKTMSPNIEMPNLVTDVFKVRAGRWTQVRIWSYMDLGRMKRKDLFLTDASFNLVDDFTADFNWLSFKLEKEKNTQIEEMLTELNKDI